MNRTAGSVFALIAGLGLAQCLAGWIAVARFAARRPTGADGGLLGEAGFVLEEDPGWLADSVFLYLANEPLSNIEPWHRLAPWLAAPVSERSNSSILESSRRGQDDT